MIHELFKVLSLEAIVRYQRDQEFAKAVERIANGTEALAKQKILVEEILIKPVNVPVSKNEPILKFVLVGSSKVGKTSFLFGLRESNAGSYQTWDDLILYQMKFQVDNSPCLVNIWDAGTTSSSLSVENFANTNAVLLFYSIDSLSSLDDVYKKWYPGIRRILPKAPVILVGSKFDLRFEENNNCLPTNAGLEMAKKINAHAYGECSTTKHFNTMEIIQESVKIARDNTGIPPQFPVPIIPDNSSPLTSSQDDGAEYIVTQQTTESVLSRQITASILHTQRADTWNTNKSMSFPSARLPNVPQSASRLSYQQNTMPFVLNQPRQAHTFSQQTTRPVPLKQATPLSAPQPPSRPAQSHANSQTPLMYPPIVTPPSQPRMTSSQEEATQQYIAVLVAIQQQTAANQQALLALQQQAKRQSTTTPTTNQQQQNMQTQSNFRNDQQRNSSSPPVQPRVPLVPLTFKSFKPLTSTTPTTTPQTTTKYHATPTPTTPFQPTDPGHFDKPKQSAHFVMDKHMESLVANQKKLESILSQHQASYQSIDLTETQHHAPNTYTPAPTPLTASSHIPTPPTRTPSPQISTTHTPNLHTSQNIANTPAPSQTTSQQKSESSWMGTADTTKRITKQELQQAILDWSQRTASLLEQSKTTVPQKTDAIDWSNVTTSLQSSSRSAKSLYTDHRKCCNYNQLKPNHQQTDTEAHQTKKQRTETTLNNQETHRTSESLNHKLVEAFYANQRRYYITPLVNPEAPLPTSQQQIQPSFIDMEVFDIQPTPILSTPPTPESEPQQTEEPQIITSTIILPAAESSTNALVTPDPQLTPSSTIASSQQQEQISAVPLEKPIDAFTKVKLEPPDETSASRAERIDSLPTALFKEVKIKPEPQEAQHEQRALTSSAPLQHTVIPQQIIQPEPTTLYSIYRQTFNAPSVHLTLPPANNEKPHHHPNIPSNSRPYGSPQKRTRSLSPPDTDAQKRYKRKTDHPATFRKAFHNLLESNCEAQEQWKQFIDTYGCPKHRVCIRTFLAFCDSRLCLGPSDEFVKLRSIPEWYRLGTRTDCECTSFSSVFLGPLPHKEKQNNTGM